MKPRPHDHLVEPLFAGLEAHPPAYRRPRLLVIVVVLAALAVTALGAWWLT